ncbi:MAG: DUF1476 domain-containing protein [Rhodobacteraceae bacterium]|nr:MAG: DUF1476 domain-containing protein [Paracoccaceae bacterium]
MTQFDEREHAFESAFAHNEELRFKAMARRNKLIGLWAAGALGKTGEDAIEYAKTVVTAALAHGSDDDVYEKLTTDLKAAGVAYDDGEIRDKLRLLMREARDQIMTEVKD